MPKLVPLSSEGLNRDPRSLGQSARKAKKPKSVLLVSPESGVSSTERMYFAPPLGVVRLAGYLSAKGHDAEYYDPNLFVCTGKGPSLHEKLGEKNWDFIGFSVLDETLVQDLQNMYAAKSICPQATIVAGGIEAQFNYQTLLDKSPCRIVVLGEGEVPLLQLADGEPWENISGIVIKNSAHAMGEELFNEATALIPWETINYEDYWNVYAELYRDRWNDEVADQIRTVRIFSRNRCPIGCKYCSSTFQLTLATDGKVPVISTTEENLISVVRRVVDSHPEVRMIYLTDDDFVINRLSVIRFCKQVVEAGFGDLIFMCFARITDLTEEVVQWMSKANFRKLNIGVESFSQKVLDEVGKRCDVEKIHPTLAMLKKYDIKPFCNIILSTPKSTLDDVSHTLEQISGYLDDDFYQWGIVPAIYPLKGTDFYEMYTDYKSHVAGIPGTDLLLRRDDYIYPEDPLMREFQIRYTEGIDSLTDQYIREQDVRHANAATLAAVKCQFAKQLVRDIRKEAADGDLVQTRITTAGAARNYSEKNPTSVKDPGSGISEQANSDSAPSGDSTRHMLV